MTTCENAISYMLKVSLKLRRVHDYQNLNRW